MVVGSVIGGNPATCSNTHSFKTPVGVLEGASITQQACPPGTPARWRATLIKQGRQSRPQHRPQQPPTENTCPPEDAI